MKISGPLAGDKMLHKMLTLSLAQEDYQLKGEFLLLPDKGSTHMYAPA